MRKSGLRCEGRLMKMRVLVVDRQAFSREGLVRWLGHQLGLACCGQANSVSSARTKVATLNPELVLLELALPDGDGLDLTEELVARYPELRILVISEKEEAIFAHRALRAGARGYVMKSEPPSTLVRAIQGVMAGGLYFSRKVCARLLLRLFPDPTTAAGTLDPLSDRELQVFQLLGAGCTNGQIAGRLHLSPKTIETYEARLQLKLHVNGAHALRQAANHWIERGNLDA